MTMNDIYYNLFQFTLPPSPHVLKPQMRSGLRQVSTQTGSEKTSVGAASGVGPPQETSTSSTTFRYSRASTEANDDLTARGGGGGSQGGDRTQCNAVWSRVGKKPA